MKTEIMGKYIGDDKYSEIEVDGMIVKFFENLYARDVKEAQASVSFKKLLDEEDFCNV